MNRRVIFYTGCRYSFVNTCIYVHTHDKCNELSYDEELDVHLPNGLIRAPFDWGFVGNGPASTALAILVDLLGEEAATADGLHMRFMHEWVQHWEGDRFMIEASEIRSWIKSLPPVDPRQMPIPETEFPAPTVDDYEAGDGE